jgi:TonB-linked SusC/RagA family outer membrane protein
MHFLTTYGKRLPQTLSLALTSPKWLAMKMTLVLLIAFVLQASAGSFAQQVSFSGKNVSLEKVFKAIEEQTDYVVFYNYGAIRNAKVAVIEVKNIPLNRFLDLCIEGNNLRYTIMNKTIVVSLKEEQKKEMGSGNPGINSGVNLTPASIDIRGTVKDENGKPVIGASVQVKGTNKGTTTNIDGEFTLAGIDNNATLVFSSVNLLTTEIKLAGKTDIDVTLKAKISELVDVTIASVNSGYQSIPKERATGSYSYVGREQLDQRIATDIVSKLNNITSGLVFNVDAATGERKLAIRGRSTIYSNDQPLIIVDNFPYEGDINNINPNDIENVTVLKDAAAASIWGVRASNGVIVITTRKGKQNQPLKVEVLMSSSISGKPDLYYDRNYLGAADYIGIEQFLFDKGYFNANLNASNPSVPTSTYPITSPAVNIMAALRSGRISAATASDQLNKLSGVDTRQQLLKYFYRPSVNQQHAVNFSGGGDRAQYYFSVGYDQNLSNLKNNDVNRISLKNLNTFTPFRGLEVTTGIYYVQSRTRTDNTRNMVTSKPYPYIQVADEIGNGLPVVQGYNNTLTDNAINKGFYNWQFVPLDELGVNDNTRTVNDMRMNVSLKYTIIKGFSVEGKYQYEKITNTSRVLYDTSSFVVRNLVNSFASVTNGVPTKFNVPWGDILDNNLINTIAKNGRAQLNYSSTFDKHNISSVAGVEFWETRTSGTSNRLYGYAPNVGTYFNVDYSTLYNTYPSGASYIPGNISTAATLDRYRSYFGNLAYTFNNRYSVSGSARKDESNYFGVNANQRGVPLWSFGGKWILSNESFYHFNLWLPMLSLRATYGFNGNLNKMVTAFTTTRNTSNANNTGLPYQIITNAPNSNLRWERTRVINIGVDFKSKQNYLYGSLEYFDKKGLDILADNPVAPSAGYVSGSALTIRQNSGEMVTKGFDIDLASDILQGQLRWTTRLLLSHAKDKVTKIYTNYQTRQYVLNGNGNLTIGIFPNQGNPVYGIYSYRWGGLEPTTGNPQGYVNNNLSTVYASLTNPSALQDVIYNGPSRPTTYGGWTNNFSYKNITLFVNIGYKFGYYFKRSSINYNNVFIGASTGNEDYLNRWKAPGDESRTSVPSLVYTTDANRDLFYNNSEILVEKGDHIRLQDINLSYAFGNTITGKLKIKSLRIFVYASNLGIIWRANKYGIDPDLVAGPPAPKSYAFGINATF